MADLPLNLTHHAIDRYWEQRQDGGNRPHLGASRIGEACRRALWYEFRWALKRRFPGRVLRLFNRGVREEAQFIADLRAIGATVYERDPDTGRQFYFSDLAGHLGGSCDAIVNGLPESLVAGHVAEMKTHNEKSFSELTKHGVEKSHPVHYDQMQLYMHWSGCKRALYMAVNKNDDSLHTERIRYDKKRATALLEKAKAVIESTTPPDRLSEDPTFYHCKLCTYHGICHGQEVAEANCRTCVHITPTMEGKARWHCARYESDIDVETQRMGGQCPSHLMIPALVPFAEVVDASEKENWVEYKAKNGAVFRNGAKEKDSYPSRELAGLAPELLGDEVIETFRDFFGAELTKPQEQIDGKTS